MVVLFCVCHNMYINVFLLEASSPSWLYNLQSPMENGIAKPFVQQYSEFQDGGSRALNQVQGPAVWSWLHGAHTHGADCICRASALLQTEVLLVRQASSAFGCKKNITYWRIQAEKNKWYKHTENLLECNLLCSPILLPKLNQQIWVKLL